MPGRGRKMIARNPDRSLRSGHPASGLSGV